MRCASMLVVLSLVALVGFAGCEDKKADAAKTPVIGLAPGETAPYEETTPPVAKAPAPGATVTATGVTPEPAASKAKATTAKTTTAKVSTYKVQKGDTLTGISNKVYGDSKRWKEIYNANKSKLSSPDKIIEGMELKIP